MVRSSDSPGVYGHIRLPQTPLLWWPDDKLIRMIGAMRAQMPVKVTKWKGLWRKKYGFY